MQIEAMTFTQHEEEGAIPEKITVTMTAREAVWIAKVVGRLTGEQKDQILPGFHEECSEIYSCLTGDVANRYFEEGLAEWARVVRQ
jgi:hypothetical protein